MITKIDNKLSCKTKIIFASLGTEMWVAGDAQVILNRSIHYFEYLFYSIVYLCLTRIISNM